MRPNVHQPLLVAVVGEVGDREHIAAREATHLHAYLYIRAVGLVVPRPAYATELFEHADRSPAHFMVAVGIAPGAGELVAVERNAVGNPLLKTRIGTYELPNYVLRG